MGQSIMSSQKDAPVEVEHEFHHYTGNRIPWYVRLIWVGFWCFAVYYAVRYLFPAMQREILQRP
jgi:hypothetical protein